MHPFRSPQGNKALNSISHQSKQRINNHGGEIYARKIRVRKGERGVERDKGIDTVREKQNFIRIKFESHLKCTQTIDCYSEFTKQ